MKTEVALHLEDDDEQLAEPGLLSDLFTLTKARLSLLVIVTTFVGFCMGTRGHSRTGAAVAGSVMQAVTARCHRPVFVVPPPLA